MGSALDSASLIMYPSGYSDGVLGSAKPTDGSGDFTFTRGSNLSATRVGPNGYIEKGYENLLLQSNTFDSATWTKTRVDLTNGQAGYDGSNDAWLVTNNNDSFPRLEASATSSGVSTYSVYVKAGTNSFCQLRTFGADADVWFDLSNGLPINITGTGLIDTNSEEISNGWYRFSLIVNGNVTGVRIYSASAFAVYGLGSIYIQDAMLNQGLVAYPYIETTTAPVAGGILEDEPRIDFSDGCGHLLLEPSRTNLIPYSEYYNGSGYQLETNATLDSTLYESPEGVNNAYKLNLPSTLSRITHPVLYTGAHSFSVWMRADTSGTITLRCATGNPAVSEQKNVTTEWQRFDITATDGHYWQVIRNSGDTLSSVYIYGHQIESGTYPTSYIPTYGVSQTRLADKTDRGSNLAYTGNYTLFMEFEYSDSSFQILNQNVATNYNLLIQNDDTYFIFRSTGAQVIFSNAFDWAANSGNNIKMAFYKSGTSSKMFVNGTEYTPATNTLSTGDEVLDWRYLNFSITAGRQEQLKVKQLVEFQTALSDSECIALTTI